MVNFLTMAPGLARGAIGAGQLLGSLLSGSNERPEYKIPDSVNQALRIAQIRANDPYASGYAQQKDNLDLQTANLIGAAQDSGNAQESLASIQSGLSGGVRDLAQRGAQENRQDQSDLMGQLQLMSQYEDKAFQLNEMAPYADKAQEKRDVFGAGLENIMGGLDDIALLGTAGALGGSSPVPAAPSTPVASSSPTPSPAASMGVTDEEFLKILSLLGPTKLR